MNPTIIREPIRESCIYHKYTPLNQPIAMAMGHKFRELRMQNVYIWKVGPATCADLQTATKSQ